MCERFDIKRINFGLTGEEEWCICRLLFRSDLVYSADVRKTKKARYIAVAISVNGESYDQTVLLPDMQPFGGETKRNSEKKH